MFKFDDASLKELAKYTKDICAPCDEQSEEDALLQYEVKGSASDICYAVLCVNEVKGKVPETSLLGPTGHYERSNAYSHLFAAVSFFVYLLVRPFTPLGDIRHLSSQLSVVAMISFVITFASSTSYHVFSANAATSKWWRISDYTGIYLSIATQFVSDLCTTSLNLKNVPWQAVADVWLAFGMLVVYFVIRRANLTVEETRKVYLARSCSLGLARATNVDLEHSSVRAAAGIALSFSWVLTIHGGFHTLEKDSAWMFAGSRFLGTAVLIAGMVLDNAVQFPDMWLQVPKRGSKRRVLRGVCYDSRPGCGRGWVCTSHALWHLIAFVSVVLTAAGTEYVVGFSEHLHE